MCIRDSFQPSSLVMGRRFSTKTSKIDRMSTGGAMKRRWSLLFVWMVAFGSVLDSLPAHAAPPSFTISATNVTLPSSGDGSIPFVLTSVDGYVGTVAVSCPEVNAPAGARIPYCGCLLYTSLFIAVGCSRGRSLRRRCRLSTLRPTR